MRHGKRGHDHTEALSIVCDSGSTAEAADLVGLMDQDIEKAHDLLKQTGDELTDVLEYFAEHAHENPFHPTQH